MKPFETLTSIITPLDKINVDTDQIVPKEFLKLVQKSGFGKFLFFNWRYDENKNPKPDFVLNDSRYEKSQILVTGENFGCGSSREHAVWALADYGFSVIIAPTFADIFYSNCFKNRVLPILLSSSIVEQLLQEENPVSINLEDQLITTVSEKIPFEIDSYRKEMLLKGLDDIAQTLQYEREISEFEKNSKIPSVL